MAYYISTGIWHFATEATVNTKLLIRIQLISLYSVGLPSMWFYFQIRGVDVYWNMGSYLLE